MRAFTLSLRSWECQGCLVVNELPRKTFRTFFEWPSNKKNIQWERLFIPLKHLYAKLDDLHGQKCYSKWLTKSSLFWYGSFDASAPNQTSQYVVCKALKLSDLTACNMMTGNLMAQQGTYLTLTLMVRKLHW